MARRVRVGGWWESACGARRGDPIPGSQAHPALPFPATLWDRGGGPYSGVLRGVIRQLSGDYLALLQLNDQGGSQAP